MLFRQVLESIYFLKKLSRIIVMLYICVLGNTITQSYSIIDESTISNVDSYLDSWKKRDHNSVVRRNLYLETIQSCF